VHHRCQRHRRQIAAGISNTGGKLPPVSSTPKATFAPSFASVVDTGGKFAAGVVDTGGKFATVTPVVHLDLLRFPRIFEQIWNGPNCKIRGLGETDS
jgi:hypothetical protein